MNSHADIQRRLSAYCGGDLESGEQARIEAHLVSCPACRADLADLQTTLRLIRTTPQVEPPPWMTSRIMAHLREEKITKRSWLQRLCFPQHTAFPVKILALLVVCISGYYLSHTVETELKQDARQQLQEIPAHQAPAPALSPPKTSTGRARQEQPSPPPAPPAANLKSATEPENRPVQVQPQAPAAPTPAPHAPAPAVYKDQNGGKSESMKAAPAAESYNRALEAVPEMKMKSSRKLERSSDATAPTTAGSAAGAVVDRALPQTMVRLSVNDPSAAPALIREAVSRSGGSITEESGLSVHRLKARIPAERQSELLVRLQQLGRIVERPVTAPAGTQLLEITIKW